MTTSNQNTPFKFANKHNIVAPDANNRDHLIKVNKHPDEWDTFLNSEVLLLGNNVIDPNPYNLAHLVILNIDPSEWEECRALPGEFFTTEDPANNPATGILTYTMLRRAMKLLFLAAYDEELMICPGALDGSYDLSEIEHNGLVTCYIDMTDEWWDKSTTTIKNSNPTVIENPTRLDMLHFANSVYLDEEECIFDFEVNVMPTFADQKVASFKYWVA
tara:strand:- start:7991 stop:8641 length:651 start_codon:yes stop_codon:yes gene_type:complete